MFYLKYSKKFKKDLKLFKNDKGLLLNLEEILNIITKKGNIPSKYKLHQLKGEFKNCFKCHIKPDVLLIYKTKKEEALILLLRIGSHSDLF